MALTINNNLMANNVTRNLQGHYSKLGASTQRLSSGLRVNSSADDAAGLAIRELMRADIAALNQGVRNANDGISMIQTADGALGVIDSKLIRMKELAEQASTGSYTDAQRTLINSEYQAMADEITRIAEDTDFNGIKVLNGSGKGLSAITRNGTMGANATEDKNADGSYTISATGASTFTYVDTNSAGISVSTDYVMANTHTLTYNERTDKVTKDAAVTAESTINDGQMEAALKGATSLKIEQNVAGTWTNLASGAASTAGNAVRVTANWGDGKERVFTISGSAGSTYAFTQDTAAGLDHTFAQVVGAAGVGVEKITIGVEDKGSMNLHFGSSSASTDSYDAGLGNATAIALGVGKDANDDVTTAANAKAALDKISNAIEVKDAMRADLGATQNRLEATIENISIQKENLSAAESRISDVDVATEMTEFNKQQILANAAVSMLSQANNLPKMAQKLLG